MGIVDDRWESGVPHHPVAKEVLKGMRDLDKDDECIGGLNFGGDGDNGEDLLLLMSAWLEREHIVGLQRGELRTALNDIKAERLRQVNQEGFTTDHDDLWVGCQLAAAAACYARHANRQGFPADWPFADEWWRPSSHRSNLVKAGALIVAEIERLDRLTPKRRDNRDELDRYQTQ